MFKQLNQSWAWGLVLACGLGAVGAKAEDADEAPGQEAASAASPLDLLNFASLDVPADFAGALLYFDRPSGEQIGGLLQKTLEARSAKDEALGFIASDLVPATAAVQGAQTTYNDFNERLRAAASRVDPLAKRRYVATLADTFFADRLTTLVAQQQLTPAARQQAEALWPAYCEAKLWELATSAQLTRSFVTRPTPVRLCEGYYASRHYFADQGRCADAAGGKNYFACLWQDGVLKSPLLASAPCTPAEPRGLSKAAAVASWLNSGDLQAVLLQTPQAAAGDAAKLRAAVLNADLVPISLVRNGHPAFKSCRGAFTKPAGASRSPTEWPAYSPQNLLAIGEAEATSGGGLSLIPANLDDQERAQLYLQLVKGIKDFGWRGSNHDTPSYSDTLFNAPLGEALPLDPNAEAVLSGDPGFSRLKDFEPAEVKALRNEQGRALAALAVEQGRLARAREVYRSRFVSRIDSNRLATAALAQQPGAATYLNNFYLSLEPRDDLLLVTLRFDRAAKVLVGCVRPVDGKACEVPPELAQGPVVKVTYRQDVALLSLEFALGEAQEIGFAPLARVPGGLLFNEIPAGQLAGRRVHIDTSITRSAKGLQALTGAAYILGDYNYPHYLGTATADDFTSRERQGLPPRS